MNPFWSIYRQYSAKEKENEKKIQIMKDFTLDVIQKRRFLFLFINFFFR